MEDSFVYICNLETRKFTSHLVDVFIDIDTSSLNLMRQYEIIAFHFNLQNQRNHLRPWTGLLANRISILSDISWGNTDSYLCTICTASY